MKPFVITRQQEIIGMHIKQNRLFWYQLISLLWYDGYRNQMVVFYKITNKIGTYFITTKAL